MALKQNKILVGNLNEEMKIIDKKIIKIIEKSLAGSGMIPNPEMKWRHKLQSYKITKKN